MIEKRNSREVEAGTESELLNGIHYTGDKGPCFGTRHTMIIMMALGGSCSLITNTSFQAVLIAMTTANTTSNKNIPIYDWDAYTGTMLSSSMWLGIPIQLIAGPLGRKYGHKWIILGSHLVNAIFFMLIPAFASFGGFVGVIFCRIIEGGAMGMLSPQGGTISGLWVPAEERSKATMISVVVIFLAAMISGIAAGQVTATSIGYPGYCYIIGGLIFVWCAAWCFLGKQDPASHPGITPQERKYIETSLNSTKAKKIPVPWAKLLTSVHFWAPVIAGAGTGWIDAIMSNVNLLYITKVWDIDLKTSTSTLGTAPLVGMVVGIFIAPLSDYLIKNSYLRVVDARRIFHTVGTIGNALVLLWMTWIPAGSMALILTNLCLNNIFIMSCSVSGAGLNILDIAPSFAGIIGGFASTLSHCFALFAPLTINLVTDKKNPDEWRNIFLVTAAIMIATTVFFDLFATDKRPWEDVDEEDNEE